MTIDRTWVEIWKSESPESFTETQPFRAKVAYLDGMTMVMASKTTRRWDDLVKWNFCNPVQRHYWNGVKTVILAFDDYGHVPNAKAITQANRTKQKGAENFKFGERDALETVIPSDYDVRICNHTYKRRVIDMVNETIMDHMKLQAGQVFIVDYTGCPVRFELDADSGKVAHTYLTDIPPCGECDIKWTRWGRLYGDIVAHSTDSDFIPIALIEHEKQLTELEGGGVPVRMSIYRLEFKMEPEAGSKRKASEVEGGSSEKKKGPHRMEYINIPQLYLALRDAMRQCSPPGVVAKAYAAQYMRILACLVGMTGTDFSHKLPHLGAKKIWDNLSCPETWPGLMRSYDTGSKLLVTGDACDHFVRHLYADKFSRHSGTGGCTLEEVLERLRGSKLGEKTKGLLPAVARVEVTMRNINWLLHYWECRQPLRAPPPETEEDKKTGEAWVYDNIYPDPIQDQYGFKWSSNRKCAVKWLDAV